MKNSKKEKPDKKGYVTYQSDVFGNVFSQEFYVEDFPFSSTAKTATPTATHYDEAMVMYHIAVSYKMAYTALLEKIDAIKMRDDTLKMVEVLGHIYYPTMFCLRHYIELMLKWLHMKIHGERYDTHHGLLDLLKALKLTQDSSDAEKIINYMDNLENGDAGYFRYLVNKNFTPPPKVEFNYSTFKNEIETLVKSFEDFFKKVLGITPSV